MKKIINIIVLFVSIPVCAQDSLLHYLDIGVKNNPSVIQKFAEYQAALQKVPQVGSLPDPELSMGVFLSPMELIGGQQVADIRFMQMFPWFGVLKNAKDEMSLMAKSKFESFRDAKLQLIYNIQQAWYALYKTQKRIEISEKNIVIMRTIERLTMVEFQAATLGVGAAGNAGKTMNNTGTQGSSPGSNGMNSMGRGGGVNNTPSSSSQPLMGSSTGISSLANLYRIQMEIGEIENNILLVKDQQKTNIARFNGYLNRPSESALFLPDTLICDTLALRLLPLSDSMLANNPMLGMFDYEKQAFAARKQMVTKMGYPMVGLGLNYSVINKSAMSNSSMNGEDMIMPMITITLPIYRKKYKAMQAESENMILASEQGYKSTSIALQTDYYEALQLYNDAKRRIKLYNSQCLLANKTRDIMIKTFSVSGAGLTDVLRVRQQLLDYELKQLDALVDFNTAVAWLKRLGSF